MEEYICPEFILNSNEYFRWLKRKASSHIARDRKRYLPDKYTVCCYRRRIHDAVLRSNGKDEYTGIDLDWSLINQYNNASSSEKKATYRKKFYNLPTLDHTYNKNDPTDFRICSWKVNDAKNDLTLDEFIKLCETILKFNSKK